MKRRWIGLAASPDVFATWYVRHGDAREGGIAELNLAGGERDLVGVLGTTGRSERREFVK